MNSEILQLEAGWKAIRRDGIDKLEYFLDTGRVPEGTVLPTEPGKPVKIFGANEYSSLYTYVILNPVFISYQTCVQHVHPEGPVQLVGEAVYQVR
jgi:hypothetical protein